jgi:hypothetical protein
METAWFRIDDSPCFPVATGGTGSMQLLEKLDPAAIVP